MRNHVIMSAKPISTWFDGAVCVPSACRKKWNTTSSRTSGVIDNKSAGIKVSSVRPTTIDQGTLLLPASSEAMEASAFAVGEVEAKLRDLTPVPLFFERTVIFPDEPVVCALRSG